MKFKKYSPPSGGLENLQSRLDELERKQSLKTPWILGVPAFVAFLLILQIGLPLKQEPIDPRFSELMAYYKKDRHQWSASSDLKEVPTSSPSVVFYWYEGEDIEAP